MPIVAWNESLWKILSDYLPRVIALFPTEELLAERHASVFKLRNGHPIAKSVVQELGPIPGSRISDLFRATLTLASASPTLPLAAQERDARSSCVFDLVDAASIDHFRTASNSINANRSFRPLISPTN
jgi:hypothetical protein